MSKQPTIDKVVFITEYTKSWEPPPPLHKLDEIDPHDINVVRSIMFPDGLNVLNWFEHTDVDTVNAINDEIVSSKQWEPVTELPPPVSYYWWREHEDSDNVTLVVIDFDGIRQIIRDGRMIIPMTTETYATGIVCGPLNRLI